MLIAFKISGICLVLLCTTSIGISMARALGRRVGELETGLAVLGALESELSYRLTPLDEAVERLESMDSLSAAAYLPACTSLCRQGVPFPRAWRRAVTEQCGELLPDDVSILAGLSDTLGQCDLAGQLARVNQAKAQLYVCLESARARFASHAKLYRTMGLLAGAFIVIVFI